MHALFERFYVTGKSPRETTEEEAEDDEKRAALEEDARTFEREWTQFEHFTRERCVLYKIITHRSVSTLDSSPFQLTDELLDARERTSCSRRCVCSRRR